MLPREEVVYGTLKTPVGRMRERGLRSRRYCFFCYRGRGFCRTGGENEKKRICGGPLDARAFSSPPVGFNLYKIKYKKKKKTTTIMFSTFQHPAWDRDRTQCVRLVRMKSAGPRVGPTLANGLNFLLVADNRLGSYTLF